MVCTVQKANSTSHLQNQILYSYSSHTILKIQFLSKIQISTIFSYFQQLLVTFGYFQLLSAAFSCFQLFSATFSYYQLLFHRNEFWTNYGVLEQCARVLEFINDFGTKSCSNEKKSKCKVINNKNLTREKKVVKVIQVMDW